jgi:hypothetical protein
MVSPRYHDFVFNADGIVMATQMEKPEEQQYVEMDDQEVRAGVLAHAIRISGGDKIPVVGEFVSFAAQLKEVDAPDFSEAVKRLDEATNTSEKVWCCMTVTEADLQMAWKLVRSQEFTGHPGKHSSFPRQARS